MRIPLISAMLLVGLAAGCAGQSSTKPVEMLDERTGVTVGALKEPIELAPSDQSAALASHKQTSFAYLGPIEWNRSGNLSYGLWIHIVPGSDRQPGDIHAPDALALTLDDGPLELPLAETPRLGRAPYLEIASWGQTAYLDLTVAGLKRMAASRKLDLSVRAMDGSLMTFSPTRDSRPVLTQYMQVRGITGD
jgi:hypothetical protein